MKAIISVVGKDNYGVLSKISSEVAYHKGNVLEVSQKIVAGYFTMVMVISIENLDVDFVDFVDEMTNYGKTLSLDIHVMHEDIFNLMHKI